LKAKLKNYFTALFFGVIFGAILFHNSMAQSINSIDSVNLMQSKRPTEILVELKPKGDVKVLKVFTILKERIEHRCSNIVKETSDRPQIILSTTDNLPLETYSISQVDKSVHISGGSWQGLLYGVGKFLRTSKYENGFLPSTWRGISSPQGTFRGMYFANHFHNWYYMSSDDELNRYTEDMALWGINAIMTSYPLLNLTGWDDPEADLAMEQTKKILRAAKNAGLATVMGCGNVLFNNTPEELLATPLSDQLGRHGNTGAMVCPSNPVGRDLILKTNVTLLQKFNDIGIDYLCMWPYDEGGCGCDQCSPWGANGFIRISKDIAKAGREINPELKMILSTWTFDTPEQGEWQGLADSLAKDGDWANYIMADSHEDFPRYPLDKGVPGDLPLINFPEISMWGNAPWGGYGAHPMPKRTQRLWNQVKHISKGGLAYSEGIYEDISKVIISQFYWNPNSTSEDAMREYIAYEFSPKVVDDVLTIIDILESSASKKHTNQSVDSSAVESAYSLAKDVNNRLPEWAKNGWRWEILYIRTLLDRERFVGSGLTSQASVEAMQRLIEIYHCLIKTDDPYHHRVRPPLPQTDSGSKK